MHTVVLLLPPEWTTILFNSSNLTVVMNWSIKIYLLKSKESEGDVVKNSNFHYDNHSYKVLYTDGVNLAKQDTSMGVDRKEEYRATGHKYETCRGLPQKYRSSIRT